MLRVLSDDISRLGTLGSRHVAGVESDDADPLEEVDDGARERQAVPNERLTLVAQRSVLYPE